MTDNRLEAACALAFRDSMRKQGTNIREANASQYSIAFDAAAQAVAAARDHRADDALKHWLGEIQKQLGWIKRSNRGTDAERAVVEAAEEYARSWKSNFEWGHTAAKRDRMFAAVEALQKERER